MRQRLGEAVVGRLCEILGTHLIDWYDRLSQYVGSASWAWYPYVKGYDVRIQLDETTAQRKDITFAAVEGYTPSIPPFGTYTCPDGQRISFKELFDVSDEVIQLLKDSGVRVPCDPAVHAATREIILVALEASRPQLPSRSEIKKRIADNIEHLINRSTKRCGVRPQHKPL